MNATAEALTTLAWQVRVRTLHILGQAEQSWLLWTPKGTANHMIWHAGHALWVQDAICVKLLAGKSELPSGWAKRLGMDSNPALDRETWPSSTQVADLLTRQLSRLKELLAGADGKLLGDMAVWGDGVEPGVGFNIIHGLHDEAIHQGEMYLLLKMCRAGHC